MDRMPDPFEHCEALVRTADKDRFLATLFAPERYRRSLYALYAFNAEIARVREVAREPMPGELRLQWWRDVLTSFRGEEGGPVATALSAVVVRYRLPLPVLSDLIEARSFDLYDDPIATVAELEAYAAKTAAAVMALAAQILNDGNDPRVDALTRHAGIAYGIAGLLGAFPLHAARRQLYVPLELLQHHGAQAEDVFAGNATPALAAALADLRGVARQHLEQVEQLQPALPPALLPALLPLSLAGPMLKRTERGNPFRQRPLPQWRRQWLLWRAARNPQRLASA
jgi:phytoene synthase